MRDVTNSLTGSASLACATADNLDTLWGLLILGGLGTGGIVVPASVSTPSFQVFDTF